ncbi:MAG: FAD-dependent oxidoreductase [Flavobacteriaceae bacterium]|nr:FAD-dependent oxidoreductase [Flavobacteriaceae bacterium]
MSDNASSKSYKFLKKLGVNIWLKTTVKDYDGSIAVTSATNFNTKTLIWSAGVMGSPISNMDKSLNRGKRVITDQYNKVKGYEDVFAIGDVACIESEADKRGYLMLASVAGQQGEHLAKNLNAIANKKKMKAFVYNDRGTMATIGRNKAVVDLPFLKFSGIIAWFTWMFLHLMLLVDFRNRLVVLLNWSWSYLRNDKGLRLVIRKVKRKEG